MLTIIIPIFNEESNIDKIIPDIINISEKNGCEVIAVNDGSTDNSQVR